MHGPKDKDGNTTYKTAQFSGDMLRLRNDKLDFTRWGSGGISGLGVVQGFWFREIFFSAVALPLKCCYCARRYFVHQLPYR